MYRKEYLLKEFKEAINRSDNSTAFQIIYDLSLRKLVTEEDSLLFEETFPQKYNKYLDNRNSYQKFNSSYGELYHNNSAYIEYIMVNAISGEFDDEDEFNDYIISNGDFIDNKIDIQSDNCDSLMLTRKEVIKCASATDYPNIMQIENIIDSAWHNKYNNALFTFLSIFIAEGITFDFKFSDKFEPSHMTNYIERDNNLGTLAHESYHALQTLMFQGDDFFEHTKVLFLEAFKGTCSNIIKALSLESQITAESNLFDLAVIIRQELLENIVMPCNDFVSTKSLNRINEMEKSFSLNISVNVEEFKSFTQVHCSMIEEKYDIPAVVLERILYFFDPFNGDDFNADFSVDEVMPAIFDIIHLSGDNHKVVELVLPMLNNFEQNIIPIIESYEELHIAHYCAPLLDEHNHQCMQPTYGFYEGRCIMDLIDF